jgi:hypothetical protein
MSGQKLGLVGQMLGPVQTGYGGSDRIFFFKLIQGAPGNFAIVTKDIKTLDFRHFRASSHPSAEIFLFRKVWSPKSQWRLGAIQTGIDQKCPDRKPEIVTFRDLGLVGIIRGHVISCLPQA